MKRFKNFVFVIINISTLAIMIASIVNLSKLFPIETYQSVITEDIDRTILLEAKLAEALYYSNLVRQEATDLRIGMDEFFRWQYEVYVSDSTIANPEKIDTMDF